MVRSRDRGVVRPSAPDIRAYVPPSPEKPRVGSRAHKVKAIRSIRTRDATATIHLRLFMARAPPVLRAWRSSRAASVAREPRRLGAGSLRRLAGCFGARRLEGWRDNRETYPRAVGEFAHIADIASFPPVFSYRRHNRQSGMPRVCIWSVMPCRPNNTSRHDPERDRRAGHQPVGVEPVPRSLMQRCEGRSAAKAERDQGNESGQNGDHAARRYGDRAGKSPSFPDSSQF
jgi:hypothetical protein